mgnify:CR=1 FL=1
MAELYPEILVDHGRHPRNRGRIEACTHHAEGLNPLCGDEVVLDVVLDGDTIQKAEFEGTACAICTASTSLMTELLPGKSVAEAKALAGVFREAMVEPVPKERDLGILEALLPVRQYPMRVKCATLPWHTLVEALDGESNP